VLIIILQDLRKECRALEQGEVASLKRVFLDLEKARQDTPGEYSDISGAMADEDDAEQCKISITDRLHSLEESLMSTKNTLDKAHGKLTTMNQAFNNFMLWLEDTERKLRNILPNQVTLQAFEEVTEHCNVSLCVLCVRVCVCVCVCQGGVTNILTVGRSATAVKVLT